MFNRRKEITEEAQLQPTWEYLTAMEQRLRRNRRLCRILRPLGSAVFLFNLLLAVMNLAKFVGSETMNAHFDKIPVLSSLVASLPRETWGGVIAFTLIFALGVPLMVSGIVFCAFWLLEQRKGESPARPLNGTLARRAEATTNLAETVYELRRSMPERSNYAGASVLTALSAYPIVMLLLQYAESAEPSALQIALCFCALLLCLFVLFWVYAALFLGFTKLNSLFYYAPGAWSFYTLYQELDAYWESVDPDEFERRNRRSGCQ